MFDGVLRENDHRVLKALPDSIIEDFYLAGGTGLALQIGHRYSNDFDFFSERDFNNEFLKSSLRGIGKFDLFQDAKGTLEGAVENTRISFFQYKYPLVEEWMSYEDVHLASIEDIALMKLSALSSRGSRKDFIDLYCMKDKFTWETFVHRFEIKYKDSGYNIYHMIKSMAYFNDAEDEPMPKMIWPCDWNEVKRYFSEVQMTLEKRFL